MRNRFSVVGVRAELERTGGGVGRTNGVGGMSGADAEGCMNCRGFSTAGAVVVVDEVVDEVEVEVEVVVVVVVDAGAAFMGGAGAGAGAGAGVGVVLQLASLRLGVGGLLWPHLQGAGDSRECLLLAALEGWVRGVRCPVRSAKLYAE